MADDDRQSFWTTLPGVATAITGLLTAVIGLATAVVQLRDRVPDPDVADTGGLDLTLQTALLEPSERTELSTHLVTVRVTAPSGLLSRIDHVTYLLPPSFGTDEIPRSSADDGFALRIRASGSFLLQAKVYFVDGRAEDLFEQVQLIPP